MKQNQDVIEAKSFIKTLKIVSKNQMELFLKKKNLSLIQVEKVIDILLKDKAIFKTENDFYYVSSPLINCSYYDKIHATVISTYIALSHKYDYININCKVPCNAFLCSSKYPTEYVNLFYISSGNEAIEQIIIETNYALEADRETKVNTIILLDDINQTTKINLSNFFNIKAFAVKNPNDTVTFYNKNLDEIKKGL